MIEVWTGLSNLSQCPKQPLHLSCEVSGNDWPQLPIQQHPNTLCARSMVHKELTNLYVKQVAVYRAYRAKDSQVKTMNNKINQMDQNRVKKAEV